MFYDIVTTTNKEEETMTTTTEYRAQVLREVNDLPDEYLPYLLQLVQTFRESIALKPSSESFKQGWHEAQTQQIMPLDKLWDGIDAE
jgi:hypothetical protein